MIEFITNNIQIILAALGILILAVLWAVGKKEIVKSVLLQFVIDAEAKYGSGTGAIKHDMVVGWIKAKFPTLFLFISDKTLDKWIEDVVYYIKSELGEKAIQEATAGKIADKPDVSDT